MLEQAVLFGNQRLDVGENRCILVRLDHGFSSSVFLAARNRGLRVHRVSFLGGKGGNCAPRAGVAAEFQVHSELACGFAGKFHALKADLAGHLAVTVNKNWRLTFTFEGEDAVLVDYQDYH
ncbi:MAG: type II toxin-antitoxin system RelE/ParE family toxin [Burkholderiales bacterium]